NNLSGFIAEIEPNYIVYSSITAAINSAYYQQFKTNTHYSGLDIFNDEIITQLLIDIPFHPLQIKYNNIKIFIAQIGISNNKNFNFAGCGYISSFSHKVRDDQCLIVQTIEENNTIIYVYRNGLQREKYIDISPEK
ncbi:672_t:CDS:1, partial [Racocetra fulgida]